MLTVKADGGSHKSGSKQAERDAKKNSILDKCATVSYTHLMAGVVGQMGYVDYVLFGKDGLPLAVVEAKRSSKDPNIGLSLIHICC